jgi:hypothetical protein
MADIKDTGIICPSCGWRNVGDSSYCKDCWNRLISQRPVSASDAERWVTAQVELRQANGVPSGVYDEGILKDWAMAAEFGRASSPLDSKQTAPPQPRSTSGTPAVRAAASTAAWSASTSELLERILVLLRGFALFMILSFISGVFSVLGLMQDDGDGTLLILGGVFGVSAIIALGIAFERSGRR